MYILCRCTVNSFHLLHSTVIAVLLHPKHGGKRDKLHRKLCIEIYSPAQFQLLSSVCRKFVKRKNFHIYFLRQFCKTKHSYHICPLMAWSVRLSLIWHLQTVSFQGAYPKGAQVRTLFYCIKTFSTSLFLRELSVKVKFSCPAWQGSFCRNYLPLHFPACCNSCTPAFFLGDIHEYSQFSILENRLYYSILLNYPV